MQIEKIKTPGLAQLSYFVASDTQACVIDPRRDIDCYLELAQQQGCHITHIFETHRNEDLVSGSPLLAKQTGAQILHGPAPGPETQYARTLSDGETFTLGSCEIQAIATPGHTKDSMTYLLSDPEFGTSPVAAFTGDTLFVGDVGRTDFYPDEMHQMAEALYDSLNKIHQLADKAIIYPAHGAGSVCGDKMANREFSTVAHEFENNPALRQPSRKAFIDMKINERHLQPPYFRYMEDLNLQGCDHWPKPSPYLDWKAPQQEKSQAGALIVDVRPSEAYIAGHLPGALSLPQDMITAYAGWLTHWEAPPRIAKRPVAHSTALATTR
ncbi:MBL fold metallo-hydrolase [Marinospirillum perlucidum]|uniref:MBL fold metallo-hydrolase n=1 Tax=Marinospirillum perlucidum TaxID=1982602 RepID=UPI001C49C8D1|nr:MBL fold metallo-hydrolase [Marinospirillum perlucidum]